jgi:phytoene synthase
MSVQDAYVHCEAVVRAADKDRFLASLFAPAPLRAYLHALYAFNSEIARVRDVAREALPGEIRLQWWRDVLAGEGRGEVTASPVAAALIDTITQCALPREPLQDLIDAHGFDLYDKPMATIADLDAYGRNTEGTLMAQAARILAEGGDVRVEAAAPAGIACAVTNRLRRLPVDASRHEMFVPMELLERHGVSRTQVEARWDSPGLRAALADLRAHARAAFEEFRAAAGTVPDRCAPAFLSVAVVPLLLVKLDRADPFTPVELPQWRRQWAIWRAVRRWPTV